MIYYVEGPYTDPYMVEAENEQEALDKCCDYEQIMYDSWAYDEYDDNGEWQSCHWPSDSDFKIISEEEFNTWVYYDDLVNYDFDKCIWGTTNFCETVKNKNYKDDV